MSELVALQLLWICLGCVFNLVSFARVKRGQPALMPTPPVTGLLVLVAFVPVILLGFTDWVILYVVLNMAMAVFILRVGVLSHLRAFSNEVLLRAYANRRVLLIGAGINVFGVAVTLVACLSALRAVL